MPLGVIAIALAAYLFWRLRRSKRQAGQATALAGDLPIGEHEPHLPSYGVSSMAPSPMHSPPAAYQAQQHWVAPAEMPGNQGYNGPR